MNKCFGCGVETELELCERCFRIRNYNEYQTVTKDNKEYINILDKISKTDDLVVLVVDIFDVKNMEMIRKYVKNDILLVLTKRDLIPRSVTDLKLLDYDLNIDCVDKVIISSKKNYNFDLLLDKINEYKKSKNVYVVGYTNAGKSSLINKIIYNYSDLEKEITTSPISSTTLNEIEIIIDNDLTLIDTPGLLVEHDFMENLTNDQIKKVVPKKELKPTTFQVKGTQYIYIDEFLKIKATDINITLYFSNTLNIDRLYKDKEEDMIGYDFNLNNEDVVISGLGFITSKGRGKLTLYSNKKINVYKRKKLI